MIKCIYCGNEVEEEQVIEGYKGSCCEECDDSYLYETEYED